MPSRNAIRYASSAVKHGGVIAYPTEAVYGLGCDPNNPAAINRLLAIKQRSVDLGLILIAADFEQLEGFIAPISENDLSRLMQNWPGPQTWVIPAAAGIAGSLTGEYSTIAVRVTAHPIARALCEQCGHALVSTSANVSGSEPARDAATVRRTLGDQLDYILGGEVGDLDGPTPIRDLLTGKVLRA